MNPAYILRTLSQDSGHWYSEGESSFCCQNSAIRAADLASAEGYAAVVRQGSRLVYFLGISAKDAMLYGAPATVGRLELPGGKI